MKTFLLVAAFVTSFGASAQVYVNPNIFNFGNSVQVQIYNTNDFASGTLNASYRNGTLNPGIPKQNGQAPNPGDIVYVDYDKNGIITSGAGTMADHGDLQIIGNNSLRYQYGFNGSVAYKFIDLSLSLIHI